MQKAWNRVTEYPFLHALAGSMLVSATALLRTTGVAPLGTYRVLTLAILAGVSSVLLLVGLHWRGTSVMAHGIERAGHYLAIAVWILDIAIIVSLAGWSWGLGTPVLFGLASVIRSEKLRRHNRAVVKTLKQLGGHDG